MAIFAYSTGKQINLTRVIDVIMHNGLYTYNPKSNIHTLEQLREQAQEKRHKKGAVFVVRDKRHFENGVKGYIVTSKETLVAQADQISHFTPNVYRRYSYTDKTRKKIKGFEEKNLQQINAFVVDIDTKAHNVNEIFSACIDYTIGRPTLILATERGYQVYFVLKEPMFLSIKNNFLSLTVAKRIADNLKRSLTSIDADLYCNDFGFFRMPNHKNVRWFDDEAIYKVEKFIDWSQRQDDNYGRTLFAVLSKSNNASLLESDWFYELLQLTDIKGEKGQIGRNNLLFTLALVCFQDGKDQDFAFDLLDQLNSRFRVALKTQDVYRIIASAYSGRYHGAKKEYVEQLLALYAPSKKDMPISFGQTVWYKHKKARQDRERSHLSEWEDDLCNWITAEKSISEPFIWRTQKEICEAIGISNSTLNKLLKNSTKLLKTTKGKGRNAITGWTTVECYMAYLMWQKQQAGTRYAQAISELVDSHIALLAPVAGYPTLVHYIQKLRHEQPVTVQLSMLDMQLNTG